VRIDKYDGQWANGLPSMSHTPAPYAGISRIRFNGFVGAPTSQAFARPPQGKIVKSSTNRCGIASRELSASITRMATLADGGRITEKLVDDEILRLKANWIEVHNDDLSDLLSADQLTQIDAFDRLQLQSVIEVCRRSRSIADAERALFGASRTKRSTINDSDRLRKFLRQFGLNWVKVSNTQYASRRMNAL
jgi:sigma54-dependent transcription regulator